MYKSKVLVSFIIICYVFFAIFELVGNDTMAYNLNSLIVPLIALSYMIFNKKKDIFFSLFFILYSLSDLMGLVTSYLSFERAEMFNEYKYYIGNSLYILAYMFLVVKIGKSLSFKYLLRNNKIHLVVLIILNIYLVYVLQVIIHPSLLAESDYYLELIYNIVVVLLLAISLLNYFHKDNKKSLYLFLGSLCIVFSEFMDVAYIYIEKRSFLNIIATSLTVGAFYFFYQQSRLLNDKKKEQEYMLLD
ncbi:hypothetical protein SAMN05428642_102570 [Flaviramulus basaltis]|uniref:YhhN-like protein n=1 Tax=Flaviramulus basaltis TaxID=369401 RepID=A0A1K2IKH0_9FLAO|nr:hypothetical protein [Flaviramulus basaltis]SFZ92171.1 hypothetical protein SAMN05428642_102570 [Flaviramulus basaltis]